MAPTMLGIATADGALVITTPRPPNLIKMINRALSIILLTGTVFTSSAANRVLVLNSPEDEVLVPSAASLQITSGQLTIEAWVRCQEPPNGAIAIKGTTFVRWDYGIGLKPQKLVYTQWNGSYGVENGTEPLNAWTHYAVTINDATHDFRFYINGKLQPDAGVVDGSPGLSKMIYSSTDPLHIGKDNLIGAVDEVRIWNVVRSQQQIIGDMYASLAGNEPNLAGYWNFDDGTAKDSSANRNDGSFVGKATTSVEALPFTLNPRTYMGFELIGVSGDTYRLEYSSSPGGGPWTSLTNITLLNSIYEFVDLESATQPRRFYRAVRVVP